MCGTLFLKVNNIQYLIADGQKNITAQSKVTETRSCKFRTRVYPHELGAFVSWWGTRSQAIRALVLKSKTIAPTQGITFKTIITNQNMLFFFKYDTQLYA